MWRNVVLESLVRLLPEHFTSHLGSSRESRKDRKALSIFFLELDKISTEENLWEIKIDKKSFLRFYYCVDCEMH